MINVIEANQKMLINRKSNGLMDKIEQCVEKAISNGYCRTSIDLDSDLDKEIIDTLYEKLIGLGYRLNIYQQNHQASGIFLLILESIGLWRREKQND